MPNSRVIAQWYLLAAATAACGTPSPTATPTCSLASLSVSAPATAILVRQSVTMTQTATQAAGSSCTPAQLQGITWSSDIPDVATVNALGQVGGVSLGVARITGTLLSRTAFRDIQVNPTVATTVAVTPPNPSLAVGQTRQLTLACSGSDGFATPCPMPATWRTIPNPSPVASVSTGGLITSLAPGSVVVTATVGTVTGQTTVTVTVPGSLFFEMDYSTAAAPIGGWDTIRPDNADHTMTRVAGIGPTGQDGYRLVMDHTGPMGGDNYWGHGRVFTGAPFAYGDRVYFRWRFRWRPGTDCRAYEQGGTGLLSGIYRNKILIVNDASSSATSRFILQVECNRNPLNYYWRLQKGGGVDPAQTPTYAVSTNWVDVQVELQYSSAAGVADGAYRIWIDNNSRAAPSAQVTGILLHADVSPGYVQFGAYFNNGVYPGGIIAWEHTNFQIGDDFDIGWDIP